MMTPKMMKSQRGTMMVRRGSAGDGAGGGAQFQEHGDAEIGHVLAT